MPSNEEKQLPADIKSELQKVREKQERVRELKREIRQEKQRIRQLVSGQEEKKKEIRDKIRQATKGLKQQLREQKNQKANFRELRAAIKEKDYGKAKEILSRIGQLLDEKIKVFEDTLKTLKKIK